MLTYTGTRLRPLLPGGSKLQCGLLPGRRPLPSRLQVPGTRRNSQLSSASEGSGRRALAYAFGAISSAFFGYYLATTQSPRAAAASGHELNTLYGTPEDFKKAIAELRRLFPSEDSVTTDPEDLHVHGYSEYDYHGGSSPTVVVFPNSTEDVVKIVRVANKYKMPVTPYSGATSLEGNFRAPTVGGICVDLSGMDQILEIHEADSDLVCQSGARWMDINETLKKKGIPLFFPLDPAPGATIGGMISTGCSGTNAVRYGTAKSEWILNVTVVLPSGEVIKTRRRSRKSSAGFDVTKLFIGAEGTLGIITEATIRLTPVLPTTVAVVQFPDVRHATEAVIDVLNQGVGIQCVELCDDRFMHATNIYGMSTRKWPEKDSLFFKFQGPTSRSLQESSEITRKITERHGGTGFALAKDDKEAALLWADRKNALFSGLALLEGSRGWSTDVCVPVSRLPELVYETKKDVDESGLVSTIVGHVGDGNFHALLMLKEDKDLEVAREVVHRMVERAIALDGTCTGEHGVGIGKREYLNHELGEGTVNLMKTVKTAIDPYNLFNPGKLYPDPKSGSEHP
ncbi:FAD-linked oxidase-like protein [Sparassis latifolia]|uniref:D-lactate dehydrogenase (cytochrome) n=1 Tax=Sparassis crispa TaxID=139825 RepID=A0A401GJ70_9APHY|nr:D-lactate dehydrogenase [cytochrome] 1, mitochondrial [Sparassis crispa]GBE82161.1 D-lactate dehydrogenase [cytochrome] 1, mitochondrial [Sparassis crispa]